MEVKNSPRNSLRQSAIAKAFAEVRSVSLYSLRQHNCRSENRMKSVAVISTISASTVHINDRNEISIACEYNNMSEFT